MTAPADAPPDDAAPPGGAVPRPRTSLRQLALRGGAYLTLRHLLGVGLRLVGAVALTRLIGPVAFGLYAGPLAMASALGGLAVLGTDTFLLRQPTEPGEHVEHVAFTTLLVSSLAVVALGLAASVAFSDWFGDGRFVGPFRLLLLTIPINLAWIPAQARLERHFRYRPLATLELGGDGLFYAVALGAAVAGAGWWAPVLAQFVLQAWLVVGSAIAAGYRPRLRWDRPVLGRQLRFGTGVAAATWLQLAATLVAPLLVGRYAGAGGVGQVALAQRLVESLAFVKRTTSRLATVALAKVQGDVGRLRAAHGDVMRYQVLAAGPVMAAGAVVGAVAVPRLYGSAWSEVTDLFPLLAATTLVGTIFNLHSTTLQVLGRNAAVVRLRLAQLVILVAVAAVAVPAMGIVGYGLAELARLAAFVVIHLALRREFAPAYRATLPWLAAWLPPLWAPALPPAWWPLLFAPLAAVLATPSARHQLAELVALLRASVRPGATAPSAPATVRGAA